MPFSTAGKAAGAALANRATELIIAPVISTLYYSQFENETFVIQAEAEAVENTQTSLAVLRGIRDLLQHRIRVVLVFGKPTAFEQELHDRFGARRHPATNRMTAPQNALPRLREEREKIAATLVRLGQSLPIDLDLLPESVVRAERRIGHEATGIATGFQRDRIRAVLNQRRLALLGFGGRDERNHFLHVPSIALAAELAVELQARKLIFLSHTDGIFLPRPKGGAQQLSFADLEQLLCLLQQRDHQGRFALEQRWIPAVHASIRAVAGNVAQVHLVSYSRLLEEILTRTGVGTMIERQQRHHVDYADTRDLAEIGRLHAESQRYRTPRGTPYVKPLNRAELQLLLNRTLVLTHREVLIGKLHATPIAGVEQAVLIGGFVIGENHHDSQHGQLLLSEALSRFRQQGERHVAAVTAAVRAKQLFQRNGAVPVADAAWQIRLLEQARARYHPAEREQVQLFVFPAAADG